MTNFEQKHQDFKEAFREAVLNNELKYSVRKPDVDGYNGFITFYFGKQESSIVVADTFVCYLDKWIDDVFNEDDIEFLNTMIKNYFSRDKEKYDRIEQLKKELRKLEKEVA